MVLQGSVTSVAEKEPTARSLSSISAPSENCQNIPSRNFNIYKFIHKDATIYRILAKEIRRGAVSPGSEWPIPTIRADFLCFTSKSVQI